MTQDHVSTTVGSFALVAALWFGAAFGLHAQSTQRAGGLPLPTPGAYLKYTVENGFILPRGERLPREVDLSPYFATVGDQGEFASCTAWATGYGIMTYERNREHGIIPFRKRPARKDVYSPGYLFNMVKRFAEPDKDPDPCMHGVDFEATFTIASKWGNVPASVYGYSGAGPNCIDSLDEDIMELALQRKLRTPVGLYHKCDTCKATEGPFFPEQWQFHLAQKQPILVGLFIDCSFQQEGEAANKAGKRFLWDRPKCADDDCATGHALVCCGYNSVDSTFLFYNSFGTSWGEAGYCWINYRTLLANCTQAYVFTGSINEAIKPRRAQAKPPLVETKTMIKGYIRPRQSYTIDGVTVVLADHDRRESAVIQMVHPTSGEVLRSVTMDPEVGCSVVHNGKLWVFRFEEPPGPNHFSKKLHLSVEVHEDDDEGLKEEIEAHLWKFRLR